MKRLLPAVVLVAGVLGGTAVAVAPWTSGWLVFAGPMVLAASILLARWLDRRWTTAGKGRWKGALSMAAACLGVACLVAYVNPKWIVAVMAAFGGSSFSVLSEPLGCFRLRKRTSAPT